MRPRALTATTAVALAATVVLPSSASAAVPGCHLDGPTKVVVDSTSEKVTWGFGPDCMEVTNGGGAAATWELHAPSGALVTTLGLEIPDPLAYKDSHTFADTAPKGRYTTTPTGITPSWLTQNAPDILVKYRSTTTLAGSREADGSVTLTALATSWSGALHDWYPRRGVWVQLMRRYPGETDWTWLKRVPTSSSGRAQFRLLTPRAGEYRVQVQETQRIWSSWSTTYRVA